MSAGGAVHARTAAAARAVGGGGPGGPNGDGRDEGLATVLAAAAVAVVVVLLGLGLTLAGAVLARHRAESAADLAALAGASDAVNGTDVACGRAEAVARSAGAVLTSCEWSGWTVTVRVRRSCACVPAVVGPAVGRARAGPAVAGGTPG